MESEVPDEVVAECINNMEAFRFHNMFKHATIMFIIGGCLSPAERASVDRVFKVLDFDHDGVLNLEDVRRGYKQFMNYDIEEERLLGTFGRVDTSGSNLIEYPEFLVAAMNPNKLLTDQKLQQGFSLFDKDGGGSIEVDELKEVLNANGLYTDE